MNFDETSNVVICCQVCLGGRFATGQLYGVPKSGLIFNLTAVLSKVGRTPGFFRHNPLKLRLPSESNKVCYIFWFWDQVINI